MNVIVLGYGNSFRRDDGVGQRGAHAIAEWLNEIGHEVTTWVGHQLLPEVALELEGKDLAIFVDASVDQYSDGYNIAEVTSSADIDGLNLHTCTPGWIKHLAAQMGIDMPKMVMVSVSGVDFDFGESLSCVCMDRFNKALEGFKKYFTDNFC